MLVVIESPYAGNVEENLAYARRALKDSIDRGESPIASHLLYPQVLNDDDPQQHQVGITCGLMWLTKASLVAVYEDLGITPGMQKAIDCAGRCEIKIEYRRIL